MTNPSNDPAQIPDGPDGKPDRPHGDPVMPDPEPGSPSEPTDFPKTDPEAEPGQMPESTNPEIGA